MASISNAAVQPESAIGAASISTSRTFVILLAVNTLPILLLPIFVGLAEGAPYGALLPYGVETLAAIVIAQLFLLAFWMAFGGWPQRWRSLGVFAITMICGLYFGISYAILFLFSTRAERVPDSWVTAFVLVFMAPIVASGLLWMLSAIYIIPSWCCGYEINLRSSAPPTEHPRRTFSTGQLIIWTAQVALPLGSLNTLLAVWEDRAAALQMVVPFLTLLVGGTPLAIALLTPKLSTGLLLCAGAWCLAIAAALWSIPISWAIAVPWPAFVVFALTIAANLIALRQLNFCWQPRAA